MRKAVAIALAPPLAALTIPISAAHADTVDSASYTDPDSGLTTSMDVPDYLTPDNTIPGGDQWDDDANLWAASVTWNYDWCQFNSRDTQYCIFQVFPDWEAITGSMWTSNPHDSGWHVFAAGAIPIYPAGETYEFRVRSLRRNYSYYWQGQVFTDTYLDNVLCMRIVMHWIIGAVTHLPGPCTSSSQYIGNNPDSI